MGFNISAMWAHYAERGKGICLVLDKSKLLESLNDKDHAEVEYTLDSNADVIVVDTKDIQGSIYNEKKELLFKKTIDWTYEQEYRIIKRFEPSDNQHEHISIKNSLLCIIMYFANDVDDTDTIFKSTEYKVIKELAKKTPILELGRFLKEVNLRDRSGNEVWSNQSIITN